MSDQPPPSWKNAHLGGPPPEKPTNDGPVVLGVLLGVACGVFVVVALALWGGVVGRVVIAAIGFALAGLLSPCSWVAFLRIDKSLEQFVLVLAALATLIGAGYGVWFGLTEQELPWWAYAAAGVLAAVVGGVVGGVLASGKAEPKNGGNPTA